MDNATEDRRPLWQMDVRSRIGLKPERNDPVAMILWAAIYTSRDQEETAARIKTHIVELQAAVKTLEGA